METNAKRRGPLVEIVLWYLMLIEKDLSIPTLIEHESSSNANRNVSMEFNVKRKFSMGPYANRKCSMEPNDNRNVSMEFNWNRNVSIGPNTNRNPRLIERVL